MTTTVQQRRRALRKLHEASSIFVMPHPWDIGTARYLQHLGFKALSTTSAGIAFSQGFPDTEWAVPRDMMLDHIREIVDATHLPVSADFEAGYAHEPEGVASNVRLCMATGVAGLTLEDLTNDANRRLYPIELAAERIAAARAAIDDVAAGAVLTAATDSLQVGEGSFDDALRRLVAYAEAGADCLYAQGLLSREQISALVKAVAPKSLQILVPSHAPFTMKALEELGVRCISGGSGLCRVAWGSFMQSARKLSQGSLEIYDAAVPFPEINGFFRQDLAKGRRKL
ncbi:isocitrate lyase/PEP mutase family protein [Chelatococcus asaccharovorans]|uniref:2-methylisocitrate lyase-like PEP mutase family enzyme n=1 Tax=Chelatococcus asaccharovorans TaxID=28210 RepID=A0A2V3TXJ5_9HYPH|nr:isocitrate lyase/phosphoenolpyruvate mutase family protein [Chelatococcus asaccharovorans]PXW54520.1 2-methylisocitrate lyase-like PEP mutase family enzyme [Chelatococcus asaccharovorans]CAH1648786.1 2-methylisocitrate lyase-like PEP mutase family enzyme [Chelatococcus asaccharovorans]CAH1687376.1 2-methylisocitrate lyase-like PEP mutase family enzyme [Chelatococcus asaccharovorans]